MYHLEWVQYANPLDLNMVNYTITLLPTSQYMTTIVTEFVKFKYNRLAIAVCALGDISQANVENLLSCIEGVKTYIDDILVWSKDWF